MMEQNNKVNSLRKYLHNHCKNNKVQYTFKESLEIYQLFIKFLMNKVIEGHEVKLPQRLGSLFVQGTKVKPKLDENGNIINLAPDWVKTKKLWESDEEAKENKTLVFHFNEHTDGIRYKYKWDKSKCNIPNKSIYTLKLTRENKRRLHREILGGKEYRSK